MKKIEIYEEIEDRFIRKQFEEVAEKIHDLEIQFSILEGVMNEFLKQNKRLRQKIQEDRGY